MKRADPCERASVQMWLRRRLSFVVSRSSFLVHRSELSGRNYGVSRSPFLVSRSPFRVERPQLRRFSFSVSRSHSELSGRNDTASICDPRCTAGTTHVKATIVFLSDASRFRGDQRTAFVPLRCCGQFKVQNEKRETHV